MGKRGEASSIYSKETSKFLNSKSVTKSTPSFRTFRKNKMLETITCALFQGLNCTVPCLCKHKYLIKNLLNFENLKCRMLTKITLKKRSTFVRKKKARMLSDRAHIEYEIEKVLDFVLIEGFPFYLIKWKDYSRIYNSWEPKESLNLDSTSLFSQTKMLLKKMPLQRHTKAVYKYKGLKFENILLSLYEEKKLNKAFFKYVMKKCKIKLSKNSPYRLFQNAFLKGKQLHSFKIYADKLNKTIIADGKPFNYKVQLENDIDYTSLPFSFTHITDYVMRIEQVHNTSVFGCECTKNGSHCSINSANCCAVSAESPFPYTKHGRLRLSLGFPIFECNSLCSCSKECTGRVIQRGSKCSLKIFKTKDKGWGVATRKYIPANTFIGEYLGEVITSEEAERRGKIYDDDCLTYLFDLDFHSSNNQFVIDAKHYGNFTHFINHSCDPNLQVYAAFIENLDIRLPRIALFSCKNIPAGQELTFDYGNGSWNRDSRRSMLNSTNNSQFDSKYAFTISEKGDTLYTQLRSPQKSASKNIPPFDTHTKIKYIKDTSVLGELKGNSIYTSDNDGTNNVTSSFESKNSSNSLVSHRNFACLCKSKNCRKWLFF